MAEEISKEEWGDLVPVPQDEGPAPVCPINYSKEFTETMDYFRAIVQADEHSERALRLTKEVIEQNPASYTAWHFRRAVLCKLGSDLKAERAWLTEMGDDNPKNYQLWYHRRWLVDITGDPAEELDYTQKVLIQDGKNYHAWAHRQWVIETYSLWEGELVWLDHMLQADRRNNSAWNQRFFVVSKTSDITAQEVRRTEIDYAWSWIRKSPNNQSPWSYLALFLNQPATPDAAELAQVEEAATKYITCPHALSLLVDLYQKIGSPDLLQKALDHCDSLRTRLAPAHERYWTYRHQQISSLLNKE